jgi:glutamate dehydrogenase
LQTTVLSVRRGEKGELVELLAEGQPRATAMLQESLMYLEIDRCANAAELNVLSPRAWSRCSSEVRVAVADFEPMKAKVQELLAGLDASRFATSTRTRRPRSRCFLEWLVGNHFTFLGYEEFAVRGDGDGGHTRPMTRRPSSA